MIDFSLCPVRDASGQVVMLVAEGRDITARQAAEAALRESEGRLKLAQEAADLGTWDWDLASGAMDWSSRQYRLHGIDPSVQAGYEMWRQTIHPLDRDRTCALIADAVGGGALFDAEYRVPLPDGKVRWVAERGRVQVDEAGKPARMSGVSLDVTGRREAAEAMASLNAVLEQRVEERTRALGISEARFRAYFENGGECLFDLSAEEDGRFLFKSLNPTAEQTMGIRREDVGDRDPISVLGEVEGRRMIERLRRCLDDAGSCRYATEMTFPRGTFSFDIILVPVRDETGRVGRIFGSARDVTALRKAEEQLRHAQKMDAVGQLTGGVAHDFNNLLSVVLGALRLLRKQASEQPRMLRLIDAAVEASERGAALTSRLLSFARRQDLSPGPVNLPVLIQGMQELLTRSIGPQIRLETSFPSRLPAVRIDPNQLELAILNLVVNARDAMTTGGKLRLSAREHNVLAGHPTGLAPGGYVCLSVQDTGDGMDEATLGRAVEPFFTTKKFGKGTGLGLSMVHGLCAQSGGTLRLSSRPGEGTRAEIWLPCTSEKVQPAGTIEAPGVPSVEGPCTVLAVDDDALVLLGTAAMLEDLGCEVVTAGSGAAALAILMEGRQVDLILTDQAMPDMTGTQLFETVRERWPAMPVVLATGYAELPSGPGRRLPRLNKPFTQEALAAAINAARYQPPAEAVNVVPFRSR
jgi:PAS domain S-box-containing protein